jgi:hypothetical protein
MRLTIRRTVREIETEWERELGRKRFGELRRLLIEINASPLVRETPVPG